MGSLRVMTWFDDVEADLDRVRPRAGRRLPVTQIADALVRAAFALGRIGSELDGSDDLEEYRDQWNRDAQAFNALAEEAGLTYRVLPIR